jgi:acetyl esterase/lipase
VEDIQRAVWFIRYHGEGLGIRPARVGGIGGSSGGHLIAVVGVLDGNAIRTIPIRSIARVRSCNASSSERRQSS